jgi:hypothetical protein
MGWATHYIEQLKAGKTIQFRPRGNSMTGKINSGQLCTVEPITDYSKLKKGDIVLCKVSGNQYLHLINAIGENRYQIANNHGLINGWTSEKNVYGKLIAVESSISYNVKK